MGILNLLKAADLHRAAAGKGRETLECIRIHTTPEGFAIAATDGHTMFKAECETDKWELMRYQIRDEKGIDIPETPTNGLFHLDDKARKRSTVTTKIWTPDSEIKGLPYPDYEKVIPKREDGGETMNDPGVYPLLAFVTYAKIQKTLKILGDKSPFWKPELWGFYGRHSACLRYYYDTNEAKRIILMAMPMRYSDVEGNEKWYEPTGIQKYE